MAYIKGIGNLSFSGAGDTPGGAEMPGWVPDGALAAANFATQEYFLDGAACEISDLFTGDNFDPTQRDETGMTLTVDAGGGFANPNIPLFTPAVMSLLADSNVSVIARMKSSSEAKVLSLSDNIDYGSMENQLGVGRRQATALVRVEDWVEVGLNSSPGSWPADTFVTIGLTLFRDIGGGSFLIELSVDGEDPSTSDPYSQPSQWVQGAIGIGEDLNDPANASGAPSVMEWVAVLPAKTGAELKTLTAP